MSLYADVLKKAILKLLAFRLKAYYFENKAFYNTSFALFFT